MLKNFALLVSLFSVACFAQDTLEIQPVQSRSAKPSLARHSVDLAKPGAMDRLEESNPAHYAKVLQVIRVASRPNCVDDLKALRVRLELDDASCFAMTTLTSYPAKRNVSVTMDGVRYMTYASIGFPPAKPMRLR